MLPTPDPSRPDPALPSTFRLALAPGVTPAKWIGVWRERCEVPLELVQVTADDHGGVLLAATADAGILRMPIDNERLSAIPLYTEVPVVVVPKDHAIAAFEEIEVLDLDDEVVLHPLDDPLDWDRPGTPARDRPATTAAAIELVAAGIGVLVVPQSVARLHHRKDLTYRPVSDGPGSRVAFVWPTARETDLVEEFIGIVRGRTANSSRGRRGTPAPAETGSETPPAKGRSKAQEKAAAARLAADRKAAAARKAGARGGRLTGKRLGKRGNR